MCGGQTHPLLHQVIDELLPVGMRMIHGSGRPVCVPRRRLRTGPCDRRPVRGDPRPLRRHAPDARHGHRPAVPAGARHDVRMVYALMDAVRLTAARPDRKVVLLAVGFGPTVPTNATAVPHLSAAPARPGGRRPAGEVGETAPHGRARHL
ncbi:hypothetical protein AB0G32_11735 [Streptomyces sp. NPDC023723]|uniref:hypothetical protein n=1 Tax=Streptomyces sp. NPDC023723 TaxID=3154323 RepID=UPI0033C8F40A